MLLYGRTQPLADLSIGKAIDTIARVGFEGAEICLENPELAPATLTEAMARDVVKRAKDAGLKKWSVSYHVDFMRNDDMLEGSLKAIRLMHAFESNVFVFSNIRCAKPTDADWRLLVERTKPLIEAAEACGVTLAEEPEPGFLIGSTTDMHRYFELVPSPRLAVNMDIGHSFLCDPDPMEAIRSLKGRIAHCHVENMPKGEHRHLPPDEGDMDLAAYFNVLAAVGFRGGMALDLYKTDYAAVAERTLPLMRRLRDEAMEKAKREG